MTDKEQRNVVAKNLNWYLEEAGKSQKELATAIGVTAQAVSLWCQAESLPRMGKVQLIADFFGVKTTDIIDDHPLACPSDDKITVKVSKQELIHLEFYRTLDPIDRARIDERIDEMLEKKTDVPAADQIA